MNRALIFDLDNTLIECGQHYLDAQNEFVRRTSSRTCLEPELVSSVLEHIDVQCSSLPDGFSRYRFPRSFRAAALALDAISGRLEIANPEVLKNSLEFANDMFAVGDAVFSAEYPLYPKVHETLSHYKNGGWRMILVTKGDFDVQMWKLRKHNLEQYFDGLHVTLRKNVEFFRKLTEDYNLSPSESWIIGDSLRDDIGPGKEVGFNTVEVRTATGRWGYEVESHLATTWVQGVSELPKFIRKSPNDNKLTKKYAST